MRKPSPERNFLREDEVLGSSDNPLNGEKFPRRHTDFVDAMSEEEKMIARLDGVDQQEKPTLDEALFRPGGKEIDPKKEWRDKTLAWESARGETADAVEAFDKATDIEAKFDNADRRFPNAAKKIEDWKEAEADDKGKPGKRPPRPSANRDKDRATIRG